MSLPGAEAAPIGGRAVRVALLVVALEALGAGAAGLFRAALALTLGGAVAIVSALWLAEVARRLPATGPDAARDAEEDRGGLRGPGSAVQDAGKFGLKGVLRYGLTGLALFGAVRALPEHVPWLLAGLTTATIAIVATEALAGGRR